MDRNAANISFAAMPVEQQFRSLAVNRFAVGAPFGSPIGVAMDSTGGMLVADVGARAVIRVDLATGAASTLSVGDNLANPTGVAVGLAWTPVDGDILFIEAGRMPGGNKGLIMTGQLGPVMQESVQAALSLAAERDLTPRQAAVQIATENTERLAAEYGTEEARAPAEAR